MTRFIFRPAGVALALLIGLCAVAPGRAQQARSGASGGTTSLTLPKFLSKALDKRYGHWVLAARPEPDPCAAAAQASYPSINGDFNGDGIPDIAHAITAGGQTRVVIEMYRLDVADSSVIEIAVPGLFVRHRRGTRFSSPELFMDSYYATDTIGTDVCGAGDAWLWTGAGFRKIQVTG